MSLCAPWVPEYPDDHCIPCETNAGFDQDLYDLYLVNASEILYHLSGQKFPGVCTETITPCSHRWNAYNTPRFILPQPAFRTPYPWACGCVGEPATCNCADHPAVFLRSTPVVEILEVSTTEDGVLEPDQYTLMADQLLRVDGESWPCCDDDFLITYTFGQAPPATGYTAAAVLACELMLACHPEDFPDSKCRFPRNVSAIARQGITVLFESLTKKSGQPFRFGIIEIDLFLEAFNPYGNTSYSTILSPDTMDVARRVT